MWMSGIAGNSTISRRRLAIGAAATSAAAVVRESPASMAQGIASSNASTAAFPLPAGATDCHCHIFDPARFPYAAERSYTPEKATLDDLRAFHANLGISRTVLVQPSVYGSDNRCLVDGLTKLGVGAARGIAVIDPATITDSELAALRNAGVVGIRVNLEVKGEGRGVAVSAVSDALGRVAPLGFIVQLYVDLQLVEALADTIAASPVPVVLDHFGGAQARLGLEQPGFAVLLRLLGTGKAYVKLSAPYRASRDAPDYGDLAPVAQALIQTNRDRLVWASDWPHTGGGADRAARKPGDVEPFRIVDDARNLALLSAWAGDAQTHRTILVDNAARLFRF